MERAGFEDVGVTDVSERFLETATAWIHEMGARGSELREVTSDLDERLTDRSRMLTGIEAGWLVRELVWGIAPGR